MKRRRSKSRWRGGLPKLRGLTGRLALGRQAHSEPPSPPSSRRRNLRLGMATNGRRHTSDLRSEEHTSELQSLMRNSYAVFCSKKKNTHYTKTTNNKSKYNESNNIKSC